MQENKPLGNPLLLTLFLFIDFICAMAKNHGVKHKIALKCNISFRRKIELQHATAAQRGWALTKRACDFPAFQK